MVLQRFGYGLFPQRPSTWLVMYFLLLLAGSVVFNFSDEGKNLANSIALTFLLVGANIVIWTVTCFKLMNRCWKGTNEFSLNMNVTILVIFLLPIASACLGGKLESPVGLIAFTVLLLSSICFIMCLYSLELINVLESEVQRGSQVSQEGKGIQSGQEAAQGEEKRPGKARVLQPFHIDDLGYLDFIVGMTMAIILQFRNTHSKGVFIFLVAVPGLYRIILPGMFNLALMFARKHKEAVAAEVQEVQPEMQQPHERRGQVSQLEEPFTIDGFGFLDLMVAVVLSIVIQFQGEEHRASVFPILAVIPGAYKIILPLLFNFALRFVPKHGEAVADEVQQ